MTKNRYDVLVAEDEGIVALELKQLLLRNDFNVVAIVKSGEDLINEFKKRNPDVIVSDINLEGKLDGVEAAKIIHKTKDTPVIFITGYNDESTHLKALAASPRAYLIKPFSERKLINSVKDCLRN